MSTQTHVNALAVRPHTPDSMHALSIPIRPPLAGQVEISTIRVGVCGTDREIIDGDIGYAPTGDDHLVIGHEVLGRVSLIGGDIANFRIGDLVTVTVRRPDRCPACLAGQPDMCLWLNYTERGINGAHGFMAEQIVEDVKWVVPVPEHLEPIGVLAEPLSIVEKAVRQAELIQRRLAYWNLERALVIGAGPIGILGALLLRSKGVETWVIARSTAPNPAADLIAKAGARYVSTAERSLRDLAAGIGGIDLIIESSGSSPMVFESMGSLGNNGVLVLLSLTGGSTTIEIEGDKLNTSLVVGNKVVVGSVNAGREDFVNAVARLATFEQTWPGLAATMITDRRRLDDDPHEIVSKRKGAIKTVVEFNSSDRS